jgi:hypothetical protein
MTYNDREGNSVPSLKDMARMLGGQISGNCVLAPGPGHSTNDRSLKVSLGGPDGFLVHSFAASDDAIRCKDYVRERCGMAAWEPRKGNQQWDDVTAEYIYRDADGNPYLRVQRTAQKKFWQHHWTGSGWQKGAPRGPRIPYRLPELLAADPAKPVFIVEGEKDADRLASLGFLATTSSGGSNGKWTAELNSHFAGRIVRLLPDNDEPGAKYVEKIAEHLHGVAASLRIVELPGLGERTTSGGKDVSDWLELGNIAETLDALADEAPEWSPPAPKDSWRAHVFTAASLRTKQFAPTSYVVPGIFPEGLTILAGRPKIGKSWMALDVALAKATGRFVLGNIHLDESDVLYAALEDNQRRLRNRIFKILAGDSWPIRLTLTTKWRRLDAGGVADAKDWAASVKNPRLIIFDTLAGVRPDRNNRDTLYDGDYRALTELQSWLSEAGIGGIVLHHTRKMEADDPIDSVSGSLGLTGCSDTVSVLARTPNGTTLYVRGRDVEEQDLAITFSKATCRWTVLGEAGQVQRHQTRQAILHAVTELDGKLDGISPEDILNKALESNPASNISRGNLDMTLSRMVTDGEIAKISKGKYMLPERAAERAEAKSRTPR